MKSRAHLIRRIIQIFSVVLVAGILALIFGFSATQKSSATKVGLVLLGMPDDRGWNQCHYNGIEEACEEHHCVMCARTMIPEEEAPVKQAISELIEDEGCTVIFLTSFGYGMYAEVIAKEYPNVAFYCISGDVDAANCASYSARMYQVRYLSGIVAGAATKSGKLGYVTAVPIPETVRSINAYALGARVSNPTAKVLVKYTGSWDDREKEKEAVRILTDAKVDVMTSHLDRSYVLDLADEMGLYTTGYDFVSRVYSDRFLTAAVFDWDIIYSRILGDYLSGRANFSNDYWLGLNDRAVSLFKYSNLVSDKTKDVVEKESERIRTWRDVFSGEIYDNTGVLRCSSDERIGDNELFNSIDWYVEGVEIYE